MSCQPSLHLPVGGRCGQSKRHVNGRAIAPVRLPSCSSAVLSSPQKAHQVSVRPCQPQLVIASGLSPRQPEPIPSRRQAIDAANTLGGLETRQVEGVAGRTCPVSYQYTPQDIRSNDDLVVEAPVVYVVGGLYGNPMALAEVLRLAETERTPPTIIFNGDFNFLNSSPAAFEHINSTIRSHPQCHATQGNIEAELARAGGDTTRLEMAGSQGEDTIGCGCGYPSYVADDTVQRSNDIMRSLQLASVGSPHLAWLDSLPKFMTVQVGNARVAVVHGDAHSLAGWSFAAESMATATNEDKQKVSRLRASLGMAQDAAAANTSTDYAARVFVDAHVDAFACTHTCLAFAQTLPLHESQRVEAGRSAHSAGRAHGLVINNGAAGMPNFSLTSPRSDGSLQDRACGLFTRIAAGSDPTVSAPPSISSTELYHTTLNGTLFSAVPIFYDDDKWKRHFEQLWPAGSTAHKSYYSRISGGVPFYTVDQAARGAVCLNPNQAQILRRR